MSAQIIGPGGVILSVNSRTKAARTAIYPLDLASGVALSPSSGALTGIAANVPLFQIYNPVGSGIVLVIRQLSAGIVATTGFTAQQFLQLSAFTVRGGNVNPTTGTQVTPGTPIVNTGKVDSNHQTPQGMTRIASTVALTALSGTRDAQPFGTVTGRALASAVDIVIPNTTGNLRSQNTGDYPNVLRPGDGIEILNMIAMGAGGICTLTVPFVFAEVLAADWPN